MTLDNLLRTGRLKVHAATKVELDRLLEAAGRALEDAGNESISADARFGLACRAITQAAMAAMLASGYRPATNEPGHFQLLIQSLPKTASLDPRRVRLLDAFRAARNRADYSGEPVSSAVALESLDEARALVRDVRDRIGVNHPA